MGGVTAQRRCAHPVAERVRLGPALAQVEARCLERGRLEQARLEQRLA
jgi:hypothetical protein